MKVLMANIEDVMREAAARWTLVAYFFLSTIFILIFASAINLDIVDGALAGAKLFGKQVEVSGTMSVEKLVLGFESGFSGVLYAHQTRVRLSVCIEHLELIAGACQLEEFRDRVVYLPL